MEGKKLQYLSVVLPLKIEQKYKRNVNVNILILENQHNGQKEYFIYQHYKH